jgi:hypothetical protein
MARHSNPGNVGTGEIRAGEIRARQVDAFQAGIPQAGATEARVRKLAAAERGTIRLHAVKILV